jgi:hypothetical protein
LLLKHPKKANPYLKNKFGYQPYDIALNTEVRTLFDSIVSRSAASAEELQSKYGRTAYNGVLRHNDRVTQLKNLMQKFGQVNKHLEQSN